MLLLSNAPSSLSFSPLQYSRVPDKEFKFYLAMMLMLFLFIYAIQAIMLPK